MIVKDVIPNFELYQPTTLADAFALLDKHGHDAWKLAGGNDSLTWWKERVKRPKVVLDLDGISEMKGVRETPEGLEIGALTTLAEVERHPVIRAKYRVLADAARRVASPQIRNTGTLGGNLCQDARCWYYRYGLPCYRAGGNTCFADTPEGVNREHALFDTDRCVAVTPSDTAPALVALDSKMVLRSSQGERVLGTNEFFVGPKIDITRLTAVRRRKSWSRSGCLRSGGSPVLLREGGRPSDLGLCARQCRRGDHRQQWGGRTLACRLRRGQCRSPAPGGGGRSDQG